MLGFGEKSSITFAAMALEHEFQIKLDNIPDRRPVDDLFDKLATQGELSEQAQVALLYRLVVMNFLATCKLMRDSGENTPPENLVWLTTLLDRSIDWSEEAPDHVVLEQLTSQLNMNLQSLLASFGIRQGTGGA